MAQTRLRQNSIRSTTSGTNFDDTLDLSLAETIINIPVQQDPAEISGTLIMDLNFVRTAIRDIKGTTFNWFDLATTSNLITLSGTRATLSNLESFVGATNDNDNSPTYSSTAIITQGSNIEQAIGQLDAALTLTSGVIDHIFSAGATVSEFDLVYISSVDNRVKPARADSVTTLEVIGMSLETQTNIGFPVNVRCLGVVSGANTTPSKIIGSPIFLDDNSLGAFVDIPPTTLGNFILQVGQVINVNDVYINVNSATATQNSAQFSSVTSLNTLSGTVAVTGAGEVSVVTTNQVITISGTPHLLPDVSNQPDVDSINTVTGSVTITGTGLVTIFTDNSNPNFPIVTISGDDTMVIKPLTTQLDDAGAGITFIGEAQPGSLTSSPVWRIRRLDESGDPEIIILFADGNDLFDNIWDNRVSLNYS